MEIILKPIISSPKLVLYLRELESIVEAEDKKRRYFYEEISEDQKAEFINGELVMHSPAKLRHTVVCKFLSELLDTYVRIHGFGHVGSEKLLVSLTRNDYEPDICFFSKEKSAEFFPDQMKFPAPDFIAEILSPSTEEKDRVIKFTDYAAHGVSEYWIIDPDKEIVEQYALRGDAYELLLKVKHGILQSHAISGFEIPVRAIFDEKENLDMLRKILSEKE
ncbi:Uma2 family endonuclease [Desulfonema magnum]|uniref:DUF820 n=1 Tax=Desulfonema magnum TaxID=45655 RepID=A0A975BL47_9BACT|nr:Uma2 family endonuclease [Desulfonema magnum]QTA87084.1 DUF820 [Desulfonema magnum]